MYLYARVDDHIGQGCCEAPVKLDAGWRLLLQTNYPSFELVAEIPTTGHSNETTTQTAATLDGKKASPLKDEALKIFWPKKHGPDNKKETKPPPGGVDTDDNNVSNVGT